MIKKELRLTRKCLEIIYEYGFGVTVLTKSDMILDDIAISEEDMWKIRTMPQVGWGGEHPDCERIYL